MKFSRLGRVFSLSFLGLAFAAASVPVFALFSGGGELAGIYLGLLGIPWNFLLQPLIDSLGYVEWYGQFSGSVATGILYIFFAILGLLPGVFINAGIFYLIGMLFDSAPKREGLPSDAISLSQTAVDRVWRIFNVFFWPLLFLPLLLLVVPIETITGNGATLYFFSWIGINLARIILLSYFGYTIGQKKQFLLLGLLGMPGLFSGFLGGIGMLIGYTVLRHAKNKLIRS